VSHNDRDWLDVYRAAAMEFDRDKLPASIDVAEKAIHERLGIADCTFQGASRTERCTQQSRGSQENALAHLTC
jgi:hypothetical protein